MRKLLLPILCLCFYMGITQNIEIESFASGFSSPLDIQNAGDDRLFIVEQAGRIKILNSNGTVNTTNFLDITSKVSSGGERGLLSVAFHPDYTANGYFYVNYTNNSGDTVVSRFTRNTENTADASSELILLTIDQPFGNHNGGCIEFGPDGYLYIGTGDGGSGGDPGNRSQTLSTLLGKMLRIDVDNTTTSPPLNYAIPADNPFVGVTTARDEIWAYGLRNPWRFSFDLTDSKLWIGDVGQNSTEEINQVDISASGLNYGWRCYEGSNTFNTSGCPSASTLTFPVAEYPIPPCFCNVIGGYVYRGSVYSDIAGVYIFATFGNGQISTLDASYNITNHGDFGGSWVSFGEDINKELYIADIGGTIYRVKGSVLSIDEYTLENSLTITPNPTSGNFEIAIKNQKIQNISIVDIKGSLIFSETNINALKKNIDLNTSPTGLYFITITVESGGAITKKLVIK
ncbi:PQQ-dependent sugar dehydrogenase [uncultured Winogradskyella sp.]|uniref:PQQ-dependent sugar dehydrogenase n=1 Tax=uncultured Winogradskyella sp. TaxID=395353 RepID=UPI00262D65FF|nr:PQQ-dependent sugar dehydrogenase [uncultured Winogradskyella sp.]